MTPKEKKEQVDKLLEEFSRVENQYGDSYSNALIGELGDHLGKCITDYLYLVGLGMTDEEEPAVAFESDHDISTAFLMRDLYSANWEGNEVTLPDIDGEIQTLAFFKESPLTLN